MEPKQIEDSSRKRIAFRLLYTLLFLIVFEVVKTVIQLCVLYQYIHLFITKSPSDPVQRFSNRAAAYAYRLARYVTLNENRKPFPFADFPEPLEAPDADVSFP